jgi:FkbM family methyltransferase
VKLREVVEAMAARLPRGATDRRWRRGYGVLEELRAAFPGRPFRIVFDVGANRGQSAAAYLAALPEAELWCFEPSAASFAELVARFGRNARVHCERVALGALAGTAVLQDAVPSAGGEHARLLPLQGSVGAPPAGASPAGQAEAVPLATLDEFCAAHGIEAIDFLKIDTEGWDLDVLRGGESLLRAQGAGFVQVEAGMNPDNALHVPFETLKSHLEARGYLLFAIYEQVHEWPSAQPHLRRSNPVAVSRRVLAEERAAALHAR